tara:strand:+ start:442 stop:1500 length:1059 start_codon:yes stop_codon:yes gene_type:complete
MGKRSKPKRASAPLVPLARPLPSKPKKSGSPKTFGTSQPAAAQLKPASASLSSKLSQRATAHSAAQCDSSTQAPRHGKARAVSLLDEGLLLAERRVWDPEDTARSWQPPESCRATEHEPLSLELARGAALRRLRLAFGDAIRGLSSPQLVGAFERWHFGWLVRVATSQADRARRDSRDAESLDPLLPLWAGDTLQDELVEDASLELEIQSAGGALEAAQAIVAKLRSQSCAEAAELAKKAEGKGKDKAGRGKEKARQGEAARSESRSGMIEVRPAASSSAKKTELLHVCCSVVSGSTGKSSLPSPLSPPPPLKISTRHYEKLKALHERASAVSLTPIFSNGQTPICPNPNLP